MLVKIGNAWVDADDVDGICPETIEGDANIVIYTKNRNEMRQELNIPSSSLLIKMCDEYASIVNAAIVTQTFGGEDDSTETG